MQLADEGSLMTKTTIYHNPRCSKSRQTLELLNGQGLDTDVVEYLKTPPNAAELENILTLLELEPRELMRTNEAEYTDLNLGDVSLSREQLIAAMVEHPKLIQRPIVLSNGKAALGRPPESVLEII
jgi:arsenate reductase (glutaredoxin)